MNYNAISKTRLFLRTFLRQSFISAVGATLLLVAGAASSVAQTTTLTYQGRFTDGGTAANGTYDMQFKLFDSPGVGSGNQIGATITNGAVTVSSGVFTVQLDYGSAAFPGADRFLEIGVRLAGDSNPYTILSPRQQLSSSPYAIRAGASTTADSAATATTATNATQLGGVAASQYVQTNDARLSDSRAPTAGSSAYIQNSTSQQASSSFNISGDGAAAGTLSANIVNATTQYNIAGSRLMAISGGGPFPNSNTFVGFGTGSSVIPGNSGTAGNLNSFFGSMAGNANTSGGANSFFGAYAGQSNDGGGGNAFFGDSAGKVNTNSLNSFFGSLAGQSNTTGSENSFFGRASGGANTSGFQNSFFGSHAGDRNQDGDYSVFLGAYAGNTNKTGSANTIVGSNADLGAENLSNATAIGANAKVSQSNSLVLGGIKGVNGAPADTSVGIGTTSPNATLHIRANNGNVLVGDAGCGSGYVGIGFAFTFAGCGNYSLLGNGTDTIINRPTGGGIYFRENNNTQMSISSGGAVSITTLGAAGSTQLCRNASNQISSCSSSLRYKKDLQPFTRGLELLNSLKPITFKWKSDNSPDLGFGAEDIATIEPLLVTHNDKGEVEGVKYDRITAVLVNAVKEQQEQIKRQQTQIESLKKLVCGRRRNADGCR